MTDQPPSKMNGTDPIEGNISADQLKQMSIEAGTPVLYYVVNKVSERIEKRFMSRGGWMYRPTGNADPRTLEGIPRFTNYFLAYGYMVRLKRKGKDEQ